MILGYGIHGHGEDVLVFLFPNCNRSRPDHVTFIGVLTAYSHARLLDEGLQYFECMKLDYWPCLMGDIYRHILLQFYHMAWYGCKALLQIVYFPTHRCIQNLHLTILLLSSCKMTNINLFTILELYFFLGFYGVTWVIIGFFHCGVSHTWCELASIGPHGCRPFL